MFLSKLKKSRNNLIKTSVCRLFLFFLIDCPFILIFVLQKMEILPLSDLDVALHDFVNKDEKLAFYSCVQHNIEETRVCFQLHTIA